MADKDIRRNEKGEEIVGVVRIELTPCLAQYRFTVCSDLTIIRLTPVLRKAVDSNYTPFYRAAYLAGSHKPCLFYFP